MDQGIYGRICGEIRGERELHLPGLHLGVGHFEILGHGDALGRSEILLLVETLLQFANLLPGERGARLLPLGRRPVLVGVPNATGHHQRAGPGARVEGVQRVEGYYSVGMGGIR